MSSVLDRWNALISFEKVTPGPQPRQLKHFGRSCFQKDYDRIIYSSAFRRLGDKTQVIPLPGNDYVRNRLTHSLEVSSVARSLGETVWARLEQRDDGHPLVQKISSLDMGAAIAAASLAHDIGNPPFGHFGESAISDYFRQRPQLLSGLSAAEATDLRHFEGNASGFRILSRTPPAISGVEGGFLLTLTTLGAFCKYPNASYADGEACKYNAFQSELPILMQLGTALELIPRSRPQAFHRHPFAFLVEAADDICNVIIDIEDGNKLGLIADEDLLETFRELAIGPDGSSTIDEGIFARSYVQSEKATYLRVKAINRLIDLIAELFLDKETEILTGQYARNLLEDLPARQRAALARMHELTDRHVYSYEPVIEVELAGHSVIHGLLTILIEDMYAQRGAKRSERIKRLIPEAYFRSLAREWFDSDYDNYLNLACFVSDMTDSAALSLYRKLCGIDLPKFIR